MFEQSIDDYIETYNDYKNALEEVKNNIVDQAFQSGGDLKSWLDSFGFGRNNMMFPIPAISETQCEICVTFYYLPQIKMKEQNTVPRPFPLPATNPINITWENGIPKIETNWEFDLIPHPPVKICVRKDKPECRPKPNCIPIEDLNTTPITDWNDNLDLNPPPICEPPIIDPTGDPLSNNGAIGKPGQVCRIEVRVRAGSFDSGIVQQKWPVLGDYVENKPWVYYYPITPSSPLVFDNLPGDTYKIWQSNFGVQISSANADGSQNLNDRLWGGDKWLYNSAGQYSRWEVPGEWWRRQWALWSVKIPIIKITCTPSDNDGGGNGGGTDTPLPNPPINQDNQMSCCEESLRILRRIDRNLSQLMRWSGAATGGFEVPEHLHDRSPGDDWLGNAWDAITPDKTLRLRSMPEFYRWQLERLQEFFGTFPIVFTDDQDNPIAFPTIGNALQAIAMKQVSQEKVLSVIEKGIIKNILETGSTREQTVLITSLLNCLVDYFEMRLEEDTVTLNHNFQAMQIQNMSLVERDEQDMWLEFLDNQDFQAKINKFNPHAIINGKKAETFSHVSRRILQILEILKAAHTIPINHQMPEINVRQYLAELRKFYKGLTLDDKDITKDDSSDLSQWFNKVEQQFGADINPPTNSTTSPWGQNLDERPKIIIKGDGAPQDPDA